jgi:3-isopropylmalate dehydrogenase
VKRFRVAVLPGDGIGPEVTREAVRVLELAGELFGYRIDLAKYAIGAEALVEDGDPLPSRTRQGVLDADAVLLGAVGDPRYTGPASRSPEAGLLGLRRLLGVYANLRPVAVHPSLSEISPLRPERLHEVDLLIVRELTGGLYYGAPRGREGTSAWNTLRYSEEEVERVARVAFEAAGERRGKVASIDKANVLEVSQLWRDCVGRVAKDYSEVALEHLYVDFAAMRLVADPGSFDVLLTENLFGDILSDEAAVLAGSLGLLPSASLGDAQGLFEPVHGSAPDIAGQDLANPIGAVLSAAMLLRFGLGLPEAGDLVERAVREALGAGCRTRDLARPGEPVLTTGEMGQEIVRALARIEATATTGR